MVVPKGGARPRTDFRGIVTRLHRISDVTAEITAEGDSLTEEGDPDGSGPRVDRTLSED